MNEFSIELAAEQIVDRRTREHFQEVLSSFVSGNTRSAIVMLWTVIVCDLVYKLQDLRDAEGDKVAQRLLDAVAEQQLKDPKSSAWESGLLHDVWKRTLLLDTAEYTQLAQIQELRHLSAHPVLGSAGILHRPNRETARACIRTALEALLLKPPLFSKGVVDSLVLELETRRDLQLDDDALRRYLEARFLAPGTPVALEDAMFQRLWVLSFRAADPRADVNRDINVRAMAVLYQRRPTGIRAHISAHAEKYSNVGDGERLKALTRFVGVRPLLFEQLTDAVKVIIARLVETDHEVLPYAWCLSPDPRAYVERVATVLRDDHERAVAKRIRSLDFTTQTWHDFIDAASSAGVRLEALGVGADQYTRSRSFDQADMRFRVYVRPYLTSYDQATLRRLLAGIEENDETWGRGRSRIDHPAVLELADALIGREVVEREYPKFLRDLTG